jgi:hypothetical protein
LSSHFSALKIGEYAWLTLWVSRSISSSSFVKSLKADFCIAITSITVPLLWKMKLVMKQADAFPVGVFGFGRNVLAYRPVEVGVLDCDTSAFSFSFAFFCL